MRSKENGIVGKSIMVLLTVPSSINTMPSLVRLMSDSNPTPWTNIVSFMKEIAARNMKLIKRLT